MRLPVRLGEDLARRQLPVLALEADVLVLEPHLGELGDGLFPDLLGVVHVGHPRYEPEDLVRTGTPPAPELEAVVGEMVEHRDLLGDLHRVVDLGEGVEDARPEVDAFGGVGEVAEVDVVGREVRVLLQEVVLGRPGVLEAGLVRLDDVLGLLHQRLVLGQRVSLGTLAHVSLYKEPEFQGGSPSPIVSDASSDSRSAADCGTGRMDGQELTYGQIRQPRAQKTETPASQPPSITNGCPVM